MSLTLFSLWTDNFHLFAPFPRSEEKGNRRNFRETESSSFSLPRRVLCFHRLAATQVERDARPSVKFCSVALEFCIIRSLFFWGFPSPFLLPVPRVNGFAAEFRPFTNFLKRRPFAMLPNRHNGFVGEVGTFWVFHFSEFGVEL